MQRRSTTGVVKENVSDFVNVTVAGKEQKDRSVKKALKSKGEFEPKQKHVRAVILTCWRENGCGAFLRLLMQEPIDEDAIAAYKGIVLTHQVLHEGPSGCITDCQNRKEMFVSLMKNWERRYQEGYSDPLKLYLRFMISKISFHRAHPDFTGSLSYEDFLKKGRVVRYEDPNEAIELVKTLLVSQEQILAMKDEIFRGNFSHVMPAKLAALVPLVVESYNIYTLTVHFLKSLCEVVDSIDHINFLIEKFYGQYFMIRSFYDDCSNVSYVIALIQVPLLPPDPPQFSVHRPAPVQQTKKQVRQKIEKKPEPSVQDLERSIQQQTPQQSQSFMADFNDMSVPQQAQQPQFQPQPQMYQTMSQSQQPAGWATFDGGAQFGQMSQPQMPQMEMGFSHLSMGNLNQQPLPDCYQQQQFQQQQQQPQFQQPVQEMAQPQQVQEDPRDAQMKDLKRRLLGLQKLFKVEKEKRLKSESGVEQLTEQIAKWKVAYENLLAKNQELQAESATHDARLDDMQTRMFELERQRDADRQQFLVQELTDAARAIELGLVRLNSPTHQGRANASAPEVADAVSKLLQAIGSLQSAQDAPSRAAALRAVGQGVSELLDVVKGVSTLTEDPIVKQMLFDAGKDVAQGVAVVLANWRRDPEDQGGLAQGRRHVEEQIEKLDTALKALLSEGGGDESVDFDKFANDAARELMKAVQAIEEASQRLENARAQRKPAEDPIQGGISDAIMDAAMAITQATASLVNNATTVQEENIRKGRTGKTGGKFYKRDCVWFEGLVSAANAVAAGTSHMVTCASDAADGKADEETLLAAGQEVSAATAQLVCAARVRSDPNSESQKLLEDASKAVSSATHHLVEASRRARARKEKEEEETWTTEFQTPMKKMLAVQEAKTDILRLQNQLERAQKHLSALHVAEYQQPPPQ